MSKLYASYKKKKKKMHSSLPQSFGVTEIRHLQGSLVLLAITIKKNLLVAKKSLTSGLNEKYNCSFFFKQ